jgi:hydroxyacylglutathione hydrolase
MIHRRGVGVLFERIESESLSHYSYLIGRHGKAVVIDPRRDCGIYVERAIRQGMTITHILETHCNEDYVAGSVPLAAMTGATILRSGLDEFAYGYGAAIADGDSIDPGGVHLTAMHTPGHTMGHMAFLLSEPSGRPWMLFTGDLLFAGDVGRTDLAGPERVEELSGKLYDSLRNRVLQLGDEVILCPAHGAGSACGGEISDRAWTTIGLERRLNPWLSIPTREEFVSKAAERELDQPPSFERIKELNRDGRAHSCLYGSAPAIAPLGPEEFVDAMVDAKVLDTRNELGFASAHVPRSLSIWEQGLAAYGGWFLPYDQPLLLVTEDGQGDQAATRLFRQGYDRIRGILAGGMHAWLSAGQPVSANRTISVQALCRLLDDGERIFFLDVRGPAEVRRQRIPIAEHIPLTTLPQEIEHLPRNRPISIFCGSGQRSTIAASLLQMAGLTEVTVILGGLKGWNSVTCPLGE